MMKRGLITVIIILSIFTISSCKKGEIIGPTTINYDNETFTLSWEKISNARNYLLLLNEEEISLSTNSYDVSELEQKLYSARVKAVFANNESLYSNTLRFVVKKTPFNSLTFYQGKVHWNTIKGATYDLVVKKGDQTIDSKRRLTQTSYAVDSSYIEDIYVYEVKSYIAEFLITSDTLVYDNVIKDFIRGKGNLEIEVDNPQDVYINDVKLSGNYELLLDKVIINDTLLSSYPNGLIVISISGPNAKTFFYDVKNPTIKLNSSSSLAYQEDDVVFTFELNDYELLSIDKKLENDDFQMEDNRLIIKNEYIQSYLEEFPDSNSIALAFAFKRGEMETTVFLLYIVLK